MSTRRVIRYDYDDAQATVVDLFPGDLVCAHIHRLDVKQTTHLMTHTIRGIPYNPDSPYGAEHEQKQDDAGGQ